MKRIITLTIALLICISLAFAADITISGKVIGFDSDATSTTSATNGGNTVGATSELVDEYSSILSPSITAIVQPTYSEFESDTETTNFSTVENISNVTNLKLAKQNKGKIQFPASHGVNADGQDYDSNVIIDNGFVSVNTAALDSSFNSSATISIEGVSCPVDVITYKEGTYSSQEEIIAGGRNCILDGVCSNVACSAGTLTFDVAHFTGFAAGANANLTIQAEPGYKNTTEPVAFYASYINSTDGTPLSGECNISFSDAWGTEYEMDYNGSEYNYSRIFPTPGLKKYNVTCSNSSYVTLEANDTKSIGQYDIPEFSLLTLGVGLAVILIGLFVIRKKE